MIAFFIDQRAWLWPLISLALFTPFSSEIDLAIANYFYQENGHFPSNDFYTFMFNYGVLPTQLVFVAASLIFLGSYVLTKWKKWRSASLLMILTLAIGSGLITHALLKDHWGRPRPKQVIEFGGSQAFRPYYRPNFFHQPEPSKSFSCGHCTMGFYFFALALVGRLLNKRWLFWLGLLLAFGLGSILSWTRMAQGGHFFSDTLASAIVMWLTAYISYKWISSYQDAYERTHKTST